MVAKGGERYTGWPMDSTEAMGCKPVGRLLADFSLPAIGGLLVSSLYNVVDRIFIGQGTGVNGMAAVTAAWPIMIGSLGIGVLFSTGARTLASVSIGKGRPARAEEYVSRATGASFILATLTSVIIWLLCEPLLHAFGASGIIMADAKAYTGWILLSSPAQAAAMSLGSSLAAEGRPRASFMVQFAGTLINAAMAPVFIFAFGWGIAGAGLAVAISQTSGLAITMGYVLSKKSVLKPRLRFLVPEPRSTWDLMSVGMPLFLFQLLTCATFIVANMAVKPYGGELGLAIVGIIVTVAQFLGFPLFGIITGAQPLWGYNYGAAKWRRIGRISVLTFAWTLALAAVSELAMVAAPAFFVSLFSSDPSLATLGARSLRIFTCAFILIPLELGPVAYFQSTGRAIPAATAMILRCLTFIAGMIALPPILGFDGVLWAGPLSDVLTGAVGLIYGRRMFVEVKKCVVRETEAALPEPA
jgi:putative MATE family efflux protein